MTAAHVAVVGGGLAGIAASLRLAERGIRVTLIEQTRRLGGRAGSFEDPGLDELVDNCQHVTLGCCEAYLGLLGSLGHSDSLAWTSGFTYIEQGGRRSSLPILRLPSPLHGAALLARARFLSFRDRLSIARAMLSIRKEPPGRAVGSQFSEWLGEHSQSREAIALFWSPIVVSACNARPDRCDASAAIKVFRDGFLASASAARMGVPTVPLRTLYESVPERLGGRVLLGTKVEHLSHDGVTLASGERIEADAVVLAVPFDRAADLLDTSPLGTDEVVAGLRGLRHSPIVSVHLEFERPVSDLPHAVLLGSEFDWLFFKRGGRRVHAVASAADRIVDRPPESLVEGVVAELRDRFGLAADVEPEWGRAIKERRATFLAEPGVDALRPKQDALAPHLYLAGDYTDTGWPATMEGATRSGFAAADALLGRLTGLDSL